MDWPVPPGIRRQPGPSHPSRRTTTEVGPSQVTTLRHTLMGRFVSATGQFLLATNRHFLMSAHGQFELSI